MAATEPDGLHHCTICNHGWATADDASDCAVQDAVDQRHQLRAERARGRGPRITRT